MFHDVAPEVTPGRVRNFVCLSTVTDLGSTISERPRDSRDHTERTAFKFEVGKVEGQVKLWRSRTPGAADK